MNEYLLYLIFAAVMTLVLGFVFDPTPRSCNYAIGVGLTLMIAFVLVVKWFLHG